jgi:hypothetical protein
MPNKGLDEGVVALLVSWVDLYVGGSFSETGDGTLKNLGSIVRYDTVGDTWIALPNKGLDGNVSAMVASGDDLYAAGYFSQTGDGTVTDLGNIVRLDTNVLGKSFILLPLMIR